MRTCSTCGVQKPLNDYYKHKECASGYRKQCIECIKAGRKASKRTTKNINRFSEGFMQEVVDRYTKEGWSVSSLADYYKGRYDPPSRDEIGAIISAKSEIGFLTFLGVPPQ